jgi:hypothetical protein
LLREASGYHSFMLVATIGTLVGAALLGLTGRVRKRSDAQKAG